MTDPVEPSSKGAADPSPEPPPDRPDLDRALGYPYERPPWSFRYWPVHHHVEPVGAVRRDELVERTAVLAIGSNAAPDQLRRKFGCHPSGAAPIVVVEARVSDHDVVHAAMVASYGSVPATLVERPGTTCHVHVTLLDPPQLEHMHETEGLGSAYRLDHVAPGLVEVPLLGPLDSVEAYVATRGPMLVDGSPVALAAITAEGRTLPAMHQRDVLARLATTYDLSVEELVRVLTSDRGVRREAGEILAGRS